MALLINGKKVSGIGAGVASGGAIGQVLAKKSDANYATEWIDAAQHTHTSDDFILTDTSTGTKYKLFVTDEKLTLVVYEE